MRRTSHEPGRRGPRPLPAPVRVAREEAAYRNLSGYRIQLVLEADGWHVDYHLKDPCHKGGGPHNVIDVQTGAIRSKRYEQ